MGEPVAPKPAPKPGRVTVYRALYDYKARSDREMSFSEGDLLYVTDSGAYEDWLPARCGHQTGLIPRNYVKDAEFIAFPLHDAAKRGNIQAVQECLDNAVSPNSLDKSGSTPLYWASHGGHAEIVSMLVAIPNMCVSAQNKLGDTALHAAAWKGHVDCVKILLDHGASTSIRNNERKLPIDIATDERASALIQLAMRTVPDETEKEYLSDSDTEMATDL